MFVVAGFTTWYTHSATQGETMANIKEMEEIIMVIGRMGSDAGYTVLTPNGPVHVPGNNPMAREAVDSLRKSYTKLQEIAQKERAAQQAGR